MDKDFDIRGIQLYKYTGKASAVDVPAQVRIVQPSAFEGCTDLESVTFRTKLYRIGKRAFAGCTGLKHVVFPAEVDAIGEEAFAGCTALEEIAIPFGVYTLSDGMFRACSALRRITLPDTIAYLSPFAENMQRITVCAHKGSFAEECAKQLGCPFSALGGQMQNGFLPFYTEGLPVVFYNVAKDIKRLIVRDGWFVDFPGFADPVMIQKYCIGELPDRIRFRVEFVRKDDGYIVIWTICPDGHYYYGESGGIHVDLCARMNDRGEFISKFRLYRVGTHKYDDADCDKEETVI